MKVCLEEAVGGLMIKLQDDFLESFNCNRDFFLNFIIDKGWNMIWQKIVKFQDYKTLHLKD